MSEAGSRGGAAAVDAILDRLIAQFASPYDFLRELVQNAMDAGSDVLDVSLHTHRAEDGQVVFELSIVDAGEGMDEGIIDGELTRLFASSKAEDLTMAGGFGIGFVSVFAWEPETILLQTGRGGETWELLFAADRSFEKVAVSEPFDGTAIHLFRAGHPEQRAQIAEAIRDSLWRWCRYCPLEVTFEDVEEGEGPELIQDRPDPDGEELVAVHERGQTRIVVSFAVPAEVVLLRHGLVLAQGTPEALFPGLATRLGTSLEHIRVWADSPLLRTTLARDRVVDDEGRSAIEGQVEGLITTLRADLARQVRAVVAVPNYGVDEHERAGYLHAHLRCEAAHQGDSVTAEPMLRAPGAGAVSLDDLRRRARGGVVLAISPAKEARDDPLAAAGQSAGLAAVYADLERDAVWLEPLLARVGLVAKAPDRCLTRVAAVSDGEALVALTQQALTRAGIEKLGVHLGTFRDANPAPLFACEVAPGLALHGAKWPTGSDDSPGVSLWVCADHPTVAAARAVYGEEPAVAALGLALALASGSPVDAEAVAVAVDEMRQ